MDPGDMGQTLTISLDNFGNVSQIVWAWDGTLNSDGVTTSGGTQLVNIAYTYNGVGEALSRDDKVADGWEQGLDQTFSYDTMERLTGYNQGTLTTSGGVASIASPSVSSSWSLDSEGNRYGGVYSTSYNTADESANTTNSTSGTVTTVNFNVSQGVTVTYDSWGRVVATVSTPSGGGGVNGSSVISDDAAVYAHFTQAQKCWACLLRKAIKLTLLEPANVEYRQFTDRLLEIYRAACRIQQDRRLSAAGRESKVAVLNASQYESGADPRDESPVYSGADIVLHAWADGTPATQPAQVRVLPPRTRTYNYGSAHAAGFNAAMCDGSCRLFRYTIDAGVHSHLASRADGIAIDWSKVN